MLSTSQQAPMGNRSTLVTVGKNGELRHLFWPSHNYPQHIHGSLPGILFKVDGKESFTWLTDNPWIRKQRYLPDSTILETVFAHPQGIQVKATDFVLPDRDALARVYEVTNANAGSLDASLLYYNDFDIAETPVGDACYYDDKMDVNLSGNPLALHSGMMGVNSCLKWDLGSLLQGAKEQLTLLMCFANNRQNAFKIIETTRQDSLAAMVNNVNRYCQDWLRRGRITGVPEQWNDLLRRSLLTIRTLVSQDLGGIVAVDVVNPDYRYVWSRDGTYVAYALDRCGYAEDAEGFYRWCKEVQEPDGGWYQRYHVEKSPGPSWGEQEDQCATILWGMAQHYQL